MTLSNVDIAQLRLHHQGLSKFRFTDPSDVVIRLGAVQAQDYAGAKWALGQRIPDTTDAAVDEAFNAGRILRTHVMRPTWHFVSPADIRWMLELTAPRVHAANAFMYRQLELDEVIRQKSYRVLEKALQGNKHLTRAELASALETAGINTEGLRLGYFMMSAELDRVICSGARRGKQFTYTVLEERVPRAKVLPRDEALAELTRRYFGTRGPASLQDFTWWSGLTMAEAKRGMEMVKSQFRKEEIGDQTYWLPESGLPEKVKSPTAYLLPNYDEYFIGFKDRSAIGERIRQSERDGNRLALNAHILFIDGQIVGGWRRTLKKEGVIVELDIITKPTKAEKRAVAKAADWYSKFLSLPVELVGVG